MFREAAARTTPELLAERLQNSWPDSLKAWTQELDRTSNIQTVPSFEHERAMDGFDGRKDTSVTVDVCCLNIVTGMNVEASTVIQPRL